MTKKEKKVKEKKDKRVKEKKEFDKGKVKKIINIVFTVILVILALVTIDVICITQFKVGPFFAVRTNVYKDGGTKVYYGAGYKVIKYNQIEGRKGTKLGFWTMPYVTEPTPVDILDLAIAYRNNPPKTFKKFYDQYLKITASVQTVDNQNKIITVRYTDPDGKYTLDVVANMHDKKSDLSVYQVGQQISFVGSVSGYNEKTASLPNQILMRDCFIK